MKSIRRVLRNIRDLIPYFLLIATYFFFVNLEASKDNINGQFNDKSKIKIPKANSGKEKERSRISIPVIPYKN